MTNNNSEVYCDYVEKLNDSLKLEIPELIHKKIEEEEVPTPIIRALISI